MIHWGNQIIKKINEINEKKKSVIYKSTIVLW